ncbi:MAG: response regulator [Bacteroidaceae bacterium]|nr:response regulator [Bacteroidaceae bacterium]
MKKLHLILSCLLAIGICSCNDSTPSYSEAEKDAAKATVARVQKSDSLDFYIGYYTQAKDHYALAVAYNALGRNHRNKANYAEALDAHRKAAEYAVMAVDTPEIVQAYNNLGTDYRRLGELKEASLHHYKALEYCEKYSDKSSYAAVKNRVVSLNGIGNIHLSMGDMKVAERAFRRALAGETQLGSDLGQAINYANLGAIFESYEQYDSAKVYYTHSMECNQRINSTLGISLCHDHFGRLYEIAEQYDSALVEYHKAYELMQGNNDSWHALKAAIAIARVYMQQGKRTQAYPYLQEAVAMAEATQSHGHMAVACRMLAAYEELCGNHKAALAHYKQSVAYNDSVYNAENQQQLRDSYVDYEKGQSLQQVETIRTAYEGEVRAKKMVMAMAITVIVSAVVVISLLWYVLHTRRKGLQMLQRMERMRTTFFTNITHEFRTPLTVILGLSEELQRRSEKDTEQQQYLQSIQRQGKSLLDLVNQLLDITRLASGNGEAQWCRGDIVAYVKRNISGYTDYARIRKVNLTFHCDEPQIRVCFVPEYIDKIIRNLLSNAIKYTPEEGYVAVILTKENGHVVMRVTDTGHGFPQEDLPHVFELFYQGSNNDTGFAGTGVGLPFVKQMMEQMNGTAKASNRHEGGAELTLTLPLKQPAEITQQCTVWKEDDTRESTSSTLIEENHKDKQPEKERNMILVVEDNEDITRYITALLTQRYEVRTAANGYEALLMAEEQHPDLIITDLMMPEMDGYELCNRVRSSELLCHIPLVVVSARGEDEDRIRALENGADAYLQKPFNAEELQVYVENLISQRKMLQERFAQMVTKGIDSGWNLEDEDRKFLTRLNGMILDNMGNADFNVEMLADKMHASSSKLYRHIRTLTGYSTQSYILRMRMERAKELLATTNNSISEVAMRCGFYDAAYFTRVFRSFHGCTPSQMKKN